MQQLQMKRQKKKALSESEAEAAWLESYARERRERYRRENGIVIESLPLPEPVADAVASHRPAKVSPETYSVAEAAKILNVSSVTVYRLIQSGKLRCLQSLRHKRIPRAELDRFMREDLKSV